MDGAKADRVLAHLESAARALPAAMSMPLRSQAAADARAIILAGVFRGFAVEQGAVAAIEACRDGVAALRLRVDEAGLQMPTVAENIEGFVRAFEKVPDQVWEVPASLLS